MTQINGGIDNFRREKGNMNETFEIFGYWWTPENEENQEPGILYFSQDEGIVLELFSKEHLPLPIDLGEINIILGISEDGKEISLYKCFVKNKKSNLFHGLSKTVYHAHILFIGVHFFTVDDIKFSTLSGSFSNLRGWVNISGFKNEYSFEDYDFTRSTTHYFKPETKLIKLTEKVNAAVGLSYFESNQITISSTIKSMEETPEVLISCSEGELSFFSLNKYLNSFADLLQLASQRKVYALKIFGVSERKEPKGENRKIRVSIFYQPIEPFKQLRTQTPSDYLFLYKDLNEQMIINWFEKNDDFSTELNLYQTLFYTDRLFIETRFTNIVTALESLHSQLFDNIFMDSNQFIKQRDEVIESAPKEYEDWLSKDIFSNANYKRFRQKILELLECKGTLFSGLIEDKEAFARATRDTRNELIHQSEQSNSFPKEDRIWAIFILRYVFEAYILELIGFSQEKISQMYTMRIKQYLTFGKCL